MPPAMRRTVVERFSLISFSEARPMVNNIGRVPRPKHSMINAPLIACALAKLQARAEYTKPQGSQPQTKPK